MNKNVLVIGSGGREHAICWKLSQSASVKKIFVLPGSDGIAGVDKVTCLKDVGAKNFDEIVKWCQNNKIDLVAVGPEDPLAKGLGDKLKKGGLKCFGPCQKGAQIEADKNWSKDFMKRHDIPTAEFKSFTDSDKAKDFIRNAPFEALVVKASGLAAGKGVIVAETIDQACSAVDEILGDKKFGSAGDIVVIEEKLSGEEVSVLAFVDSTTVRTMLPAQDHKRLKDYDMGPNTGGMGAYCPCPIIKTQEMDVVIKKVLQKAVDGMRKEGIEYNGILYAGMMMTPNGPKTLEFNCRFGDPETQVILPLLESDLYEIMDACCSNKLKEIELKFREGISAVGVVMASKGYPETSTKGCEITGMQKISQKEDHIVFHSGVAKNEKGEFVTNGGRVLISVVLNEDLKLAASLATSACHQINFEGSQFRSDIAHKAFKYFGLSYKDSGVDIDAGDALVQRIKLLAGGTVRDGSLGGLGGFGGMFRLKNMIHKYNDPVLVQGTDGVGTKLKIAEKVGVWDSIGIDLVAMCVNDVLCAGAEPIAFLDYIACGHLDVPTAALIVKGISEGCRESHCALVGGETAEMPSIYKSGKYDLAGYSVGIVEHDAILPKIDEISENDLVIGLPSSGVHSNGFSLVNKIMESNGLKFTDKAHFSCNGESFGHEFLIPTKLYVKPVLNLLRKKTVKAIAHITGGGLIENVPRVLRNDLGVSIDASTFEILPVFGWLKEFGHVDDFEMLRTLNCGIGMVLIVPENDESWMELSESFGAVKIGKVVKRNPNEKQVIVNNFSGALKKASAPFKNLPKKSSVAISYKDSGVDIVQGDKLIDKIKPFAKSTNRPGVIGGLGGFGGLFRLKDVNCEDPVLVMGTDGVGTKLKIAQQINNHKTIGVDLVSMCVNDILCDGAEPLTFLDYYACGHLDVNVAADVINGISNGCLQSGSVLLGGETAEMPGMYEKDVYDIAGFALGVVDYKSILPKIKKIEEGDILIGLPSSGLHSNGFSLVHTVLDLDGKNFNNLAPFSTSGKTFGEEFLTPTKIYVPTVLPLVKAELVKALAHITGGGLLDNIPRILPSHLAVEIDANNFNIPPHFAWLSKTGRVDSKEMLRTFNCGVGMVLVVSPTNIDAISEKLIGCHYSVIGKIVRHNIGYPKVDVKSFSFCLTKAQQLLSLPMKRIAVLISGSGSNLQALVEATRDTSFGIRGKIVFVISNKSGVFGLVRAAKAGIPSIVINHKDYKTREEFDQMMTKELEKQEIELICLAGFMRILSEPFVQKWKGRLINIHPALLPKHKGIHVQKRAIDSGDKESGCTVHFVDQGVDTGANIIQEKVPIYPEDTEETLTARIHKMEHIAFPKALRLVANNSVSYCKNSGATIWH